VATLNGTTKNLLFPETYPSYNVYELSFLGANLLFESSWDTYWSITVPGVHMIFVLMRV